MIILRSLLILLMTVGIASCGFQLRGLSKLPAEFETLSLTDSGLSRDQQALLTLQFKRAGAALIDANDTATAPRLRVVFESTKIRRLVNSASSDQVVFRVSRVLKYALSFVDTDRVPAVGQISDSIDIEVDENDVDGRNSQRLEAETRIDKNLTNQLVSRIRRL